MIIIETPRLHFRTWQAADMDLAHTLWGNPDVMKFVDSRSDLSGKLVEERLKKEIQTQAEFGIQYWPIFESSSGEFVGCCGLRPWVYTPRPCLELGFHLMPNKWGKGFGTEAAQSAISYASNKLSAPLVMAGHHPDNAGSKKILTSLGFKFLEAIHYKPTGLMHPIYELTFQK